MKNKKITLVILFSIVILCALSCVIYFCAIQPNSNLNANKEPGFIVQDLSETQIKELEQNAESTEANEDGSKTFTVNSKCGDSEGILKITINKDYNIESQTFRTWPYMIEPPYVTDENGTIHYDETLEPSSKEIKDAYKKFDKELSKILNDIDVKTIQWYEEHMVNEELIIENLNKLPNAKTMNQKFLDDNTLMCYCSDVELNDGTTMNITILTVGYYSLGIDLSNTSIYNN